MKKYLYGTTALAAVALAAGPALAEAEPLHMELGGYYTVWYAYVDSDFAAGGSSSVGDFTSTQNAEVYFRMRGELDNGLRIGGRIELEGESTGDQIDQHYLVLAGGFGEFRLGSINSGRYSYGWNTDAPAVGIGINSGWMSTLVAPQNNSGSRYRSVGLSTVIDFSNDENKITYFTPRFNGFQLTASWTPRGHMTASGSVGQGGTGYFFTGPADENLINTNGLDVGLSYSGDFDGVGIEVQAGIATADASNQADNAGLDDPFAYNGGLAVSYAGFKVAASFAVIDEALGLSCGTAEEAEGEEEQVYPIGTAFCEGSNEGGSFNIGVGYSTGPWGFSLTYFRGEEEGLTAIPGGDENSFVEIAASYTLGPGLRMSLSALDIDFDGDAAGPADDNDGIAVVFGVHAGF
jgi:outer membrane protein OmpU